MKPPSYELQAASQPGEAAPISTKLRGGAQEAHRDGGASGARALRGAQFGEAAASVRETLFETLFESVA